MKAVEVKVPTKVHDILSHHTYLMYFPHPSVITAIARYYSENNMMDEIAQLIDILSQGVLLKVEAETVDIAIKTLQ